MRVLMVALVLSIFVVVPSGCCGGKSCTEIYDDCAHECNDNEEGSTEHLNCLAPCVVELDKCNEG